MSTVGGGGDLEYGEGGDLEYGEGVQYHGRYRDKCVWGVS